VKRGFLNEEQRGILFRNDFAYLLFSIRHFFINEEIKGQRQLWPIEVYVPFPVSPKVGKNLLNKIL